MAAEILEKNHKDTETIIWQAPESEYNPKGVSWHWLSIIIGIILIGISIWQNNFLFAIFIAIAVLVVNIMAKRFPAIWEFKISGKGILISLPDGSNAKFYSLEDLESFDIHEGVSNDDEYKELIFKINSKFYPFIKINFYLKDEEKIKNFLLNFLPKKEHPGSLIDSMIKLIGF